MKYVVIVGETKLFIGHYGLTALYSRAKKFNNRKEALEQGQRFAKATKTDFVVRIVDND